MRQTRVVIEDENGERRVQFVPRGTVIANRPDDIATKLRRRRNALLRLTDWRETVGIPNGATDAEDWVTYRQALRDLPQQEGWPDNVTWPTPPEIEL